MTNVVSTEEEKPVSDMPSTDRCKPCHAFTKNWLSLQRPADYFLVSLQGNIATFRVEPLERGFGITLGNALRRIMLSSLHGMSLTSVRIDGVEHEYSSVHGMREDVLDVVLNLKSVVLSSSSFEKCVLRLKATGPCEVTAGMMDTGSTDVKVVSSDLVICHLDKGATVNMELTATGGKGYVNAEKNRVAGAPLSTIFMDSLFSPVKRVSFRVDGSRVGSNTDYDRLYITIETNGSIAPDTALALAAKIMQDQLQVLINFSDVERPEEEQGEVLPFDTKLLIRVENLELSVRAQNCLKNENIVYVGDLVTKSESKMMQTPNFGKKSLNEIKQLLENMNLKFGMEVAAWPPANVEELSAKYEEEGR